eukprot:scaffold1_cov402-Prasinococcus_capsulatus_cf.AAC.52
MFADSLGHSKSSKASAALVDGMVAMACAACLCSVLPPREGRLPVQSICYKCRILSTKVAHSEDMKQ